MGRGNQLAARMLSPPLPLAGEGGGGWGVTPEVRARARKIRLVAMDVDGVLTDAGMYYTESGDELKKFNTRDGMGVALVRRPDSRRRS